MDILPTLICSLLGEFTESTELTAMDNEFSYFTQTARLSTG